MEQAREALQQELNVIEIVNAQRILKSALNYLLPPQKLEEIKRETRYKIIDPDEKPLSGPSLPSPTRRNRRPMRLTADEDESQI